MNLFVIILIIIVILIAIYLIRGMTTRGFATGIAKANLRSFLTMRKNYPDEDRLIIYRKMILQRPTYTEQKADEILNNALGYTSYGGIIGYIPQKETERARQELKLWMVILAIVVYEYLNLRRDVNGVDLGMKMKAMEEEVKSIVPVDL